MEKDKITQQIKELIEAGLFRDLRCILCNSYMITTDLNFQYPVSDRMG